MRILNLVTVAIFAVSTPALAERPEDKLWLQAGVFRAKADTFARVDNQELGLPGTRIDFEQDLGLRDSEWLPKLAGGVRIGRKLRVEADYFSLDREGSTTLSALLGVDNTQFPPGAEVDTQFKTDIWRIALGWSPVLTEHGEFGVAVGVHLTDVKFSLIAEVPVAGESIILSEDRQATILLPNVSVFGNYNLSRIWAIHGKVDLLSLKVGDHKGQLVDAQIGVSARVHRNIGLGLAYRYVDYDLETRRQDWGGELQYRYYGPLAFVEIGF